MTSHEITYIARATTPMFGIMCIELAMIVLLPETTTALPAKMYDRCL